MRECGMLLPVASLPSRYGIGAFSKEAYDFIDTLKAAGQSFWQILPLGPTGFGDSPYQSFSAFAGNPYFGRKAGPRSWFMSWRDGNWGMRPGSIVFIWR